MCNRLFAVLLLLICTLPAHAGLVLQGSRIIYDEARGEATVKLEYVGDGPILLQIWMDTGKSSAAPGEDEVPFILTPAVARLEPGGGQTVRILRIGDGLPQDRESVFYFNTLEVPPSPTGLIADGEAFMQFSIRGRFKFFYRPKGLPSASGKAIESLRFALDEPDAEGRFQVRVYNPSPYHVTFSSLALRVPGTADEDVPLVRFNTDAPGERMVAPMGELVLPMTWETLAPGMRLPGEVEADFIIITDLGGIERQQRRLD